MSRRAGSLCGLCALGDGRPILSVRKMKLAGDRAEYQNE